MGFAEQKNTQTVKCCPPCKKGRKTTMCIQSPKAVILSDEVEIEGVLILQLDVILRA